MKKIILSLSKLPLCLLQNNIVIVIDQNRVYLNAQLNTVSHEAVKVNAELHITRQDLLSALTNDGNIGLLVINKRASISGNARLIFLLSDLIG